MERIGRAYGLLLSPLALAVGIYLPAELGVGILLGALARYVVAPKSRHGTHRGILTAAGLISGYALLSLCVGSLISAGLGDWLTENFQSSRYYSGAGVALMMMLGLLAYNYFGETDDNNADSDVHAIDTVDAAHDSNDDPEKESER